MFYMCCLLHQLCVCCMSVCCALHRSTLPRGMITNCVSCRVGTCSYNDPLTVPRSLHRVYKYPGLPPPPRPVYRAVPTDSGQARRAECEKNVNVGSAARPRPPPPPPMRWWWKARRGTGGPLFTFDMQADRTRCGG